MKQTAEQVLAGYLTAEERKSLAEGLRAARGICDRFASRIEAQGLDAEAIERRRQRYRGSRVGFEIALHEAEVAVLRYEAEHGKGPGEGSPLARAVDDAETALENSDFQHRYWDHAVHPEAEEFVKSLRTICFYCVRALNALGE